MLVVLSAATTVLTIAEAQGAWSIAVAAGVLVLAGGKSRVILASYLGLAGSRFWMRAINGAIAGFLMLAFGIFLIGWGG